MRRMRMVDNHEEGSMGTHHFLGKDRAVKFTHRHQDGRIGSFEWCDRAGIRQRICIALREVTWDDE